MDHFILLSRGPSKGDDSTSSKDAHGCPILNTSGPTIVPFVGNLTYHQFSTILAGACGLLSAIIIAVSIATHAVNYSNPVQQRQIIRVFLLIPWIALFSFLTIWREDAGPYLKTALDFGCAIALSAFLLLMCDFVLAHRGGYDDLFGKGAESRGTSSKGKSPVSLKRMWYGVLQYIPTSIIIWLAIDISLAVGTYCEQSNSPHFASIWLTIFEGFVVTAAIVNCVRFYSQNKEKLSQHKILLKLLTFKGIIGLNGVQTFIFSILNGKNTFKPTKYMTYHDIYTGFPALLLICELPIFSVLLIFAFPPMIYKNDSPAAGPLSAIVDAFNITDLLSSFVRGPMRLVKDQQRQIMQQGSLRIDLGNGQESRVKNSWVSGAV
ncbi:organic solute transporter Ostalpha-domain-containing protein [Phaeosphaeriaceae sp. PMI808]|nr:organic solute transporter Ostalpha-domain-containing protein [Phaeosphaeriaceae sp. PMI808]